MISQLFILSPRGDCIIFRDYRVDCPKSTPEIFFRKLRFWTAEESSTSLSHANTTASSAAASSPHEEAPPAFNVDGINFIHTKTNGLFFVATTRSNASPSFVLELLHRVARAGKDYLGVLNEESVRKNFVLVYELLDEMLDFGYPQSTSTEVLKSFIFNEPVPIDASANLPPALAVSSAAASLFMMAGGGQRNRLPSSAVMRPVVSSPSTTGTDMVGAALGAAGVVGPHKREEVFVDVVERMSVTFNARGYVQHSEIDGTIQMKSFLSGGPEIRLALNEDLVIGQRNAPHGGYGAELGYGGGSSSALGSSNLGLAILDDCNFHECVRMDDFDIDRTLTLLPPEGEFSVINYRSTQPFSPPFHLQVSIDDGSLSVHSTPDFRTEVRLRLRADFPPTNTANTITVRLPLPKSVVKVSCSLEPGMAGGGQTTEFKESTRTLEWSIKKMAGGVEHSLRARLTMASDRVGGGAPGGGGPIAWNRKEVGPASLSFVIPMFNASRLQVRYLQIMKKAKAYNPFRWVRYVTHAQSYVVRL